jgi:hypothetical protein
VVLHAPDRRFLEARFAASYERLNAMFLKIDHLHFRALMRYLTNRFEELGEALLEVRRGHGERQALGFGGGRTARADALAAADEGVRRSTRGGCAPRGGGGRRRGRFEI